MKNYDCIIIGNGSVSFAIGYELDKKSSSTFKIGIFGKKSRIGSASLAAGAMINIFGEVEYDSLSSLQGKQKFKDMLKSRQYWQTLVEALNFNKKIVNIKKGTYVINNSSANDLDDENFNAIQTALKKYKEKFYHVNNRDIPGYNPTSRYRSFKSIFIPEENFIPSTDNLLNAYEKYFIHRKKIEIFDENILKIEKKNREFKLYSSTGEIYISKKIVIAAGAYSQKLIDQFPQISKKIPRTYFGTGTALIIKTNTKHDIKSVIRTPNRGLACGLHVVPLNKDHLYIGATNRISKYENNFPILTTTQTLQNSFLKEINNKLGNSEIKKICIGHRPTTLDTFPIIGKTSLKNLYICTGTKRDGLTFSPFIAKKLTSLILETKQDSLSQYYKPERQLSFTMTKEEGIKKTVRHYISAAFQHGLNLPNNTNEETYKKEVLDSVTKIYKKLNVKFGIQPEVLNLYKKNKKNAN